MIKLMIYHLSDITKFGVFHADGSIFFTKHRYRIWYSQIFFNERGIGAFCEDNAANHMKEFRTVQYLRTDMSPV
jgi:hypothetical protein